MSVSIIYQVQSIRGFILKGKIMSNELVSVIIPTYGRSLLLKRAIFSVLEQDYKNVEVIVVNDNKKDSIDYISTITVMKEFDSFSNIVFISSGENVGGSEARNIGIKHSNGKYITFLDDDDYFYKDKIRKQVEHLIKNDIDVSVCDMDLDINGNVASAKKGRCNIGSIGNFISYGNSYTPMFLMKKGVLEVVNGFTITPRFQDHVLMLKILENDFKVGELHDSLFVHTEHEGQGITSEKNFKTGYLIRTEIEKRNLFRVSVCERNRYFVGYYLSMARLLRNEGFFVKAIKHIFYALFYVRSIDDLIRVSKRTISILILKSSRN